MRPRSDKLVLHSKTELLLLAFSLQKKIVENRPGTQAEVNSLLLTMWRTLGVSG
jgi:hypothetical protein